MKKLHKKGDLIAQLKHNGDTDITQHCDSMDVNSCQSNCALFNAKKCVDYPDLVEKLQNPEIPAARFKTVESTMELIEELEGEL